MVKSKVPDYVNVVVVGPASQSYGYKGHEFTGVKTYGSPKIGKTHAVSPKHTIMTDEFAKTNPQVMKQIHEALTKKADGFVTGPIWTASNTGDHVVDKPLSKYKPPHPGIDHDVNPFEDVHPLHTSFTPMTYDKFMDKFMDTLTDKEKAFHKNAKVHYPSDSDLPF